MQAFNFHMPVKIVFGPGRVSELAGGLNPSINRVLIVTDQNLASGTDCLDRVMGGLKGKDVHIFDEVEENPSLSTVEKGGAFARENDVQAVVGLGGGSPMDAAKGIAVLCVNDGGMKGYMQGDPLAVDPLPVVCIPTTSGTGSETTPFAVFTDTNDQSKAGFSHVGIYPKVSIVDPELTYSMPESVVINTGLDALTHGIEAYLSTEAFPLNDALAVESIGAALKNLNKAARKDPDAMIGMAYASMVAGAAIAHASTILLHIMGYPLTVFHGLPHGKANAVLLPAFMAFMKRSPRAETKVARIEAMFEPVGGIEKFVNDLGVSTKLSDHGVQASELELYVKKVMVKDDVKITPAEVTDDAVLTLYRSAL